MRRTKMPHLSRDVAIRWEMIDCQEVACLGIFLHVHDMIVHYYLDLYLYHLIASFAARLKSSEGPRAVAFFKLPTGLLNR